MADHGDDRHRPEVTGFYHEATGSVAYVAADPASRRCAIVDPVLDFDSANGATGTRFADDMVAFVRQRGLAVDLIRPVIEGNKVHATLAVSYDTPATGDETTLNTEVRHNLTVVLESGKPVTIAESADPAADRRVALQVKATILR